MTKHNKNKYKYYNAGTVLGIIGIPTTSIKHTSGKYTFIASGVKNWIETIDLKDTFEESEKSRIAKFL